MNTEMNQEIFTKLAKRETGHQGVNMMIPDSLKKNARKLCRELNTMDPDDRPGTLNVYQSLFGGSTDLLFIAPPFHCDYGFNITFAGLAVVNYNCTILDTSEVRIGKNAFIGPNVCLSCASHAIDPQQRAEGITLSKPIVLEDDVWIGANSVICPGVTIGKGSVIGAGSVVNKSVPAGVVAAGSPCRVIREISEQERIDPESLDY